MRSLLASPLSLSFAAAASRIDRVPIILRRNVHLAAGSGFAPMSAALSMVPIGSSSKPTGAILPGKHEPSRKGTELEIFWHFRVGGVAQGRAHPGLDETCGSSGATRRGFQDDVRVEVREGWWVGCCQ